MWSLAGGLYPAIDLCAGEQERGTMGTLLIRPASRDEIVWGQFLAIRLFSGATALLNLASMGLTTWQSGNNLRTPGPRPAARVLVAMVVYGWMALRWAAEQFQREEVLFREAERIDLGLWVRHLFRDKESYPTPSQGLFCFGLLLVLRWVGAGLGLNRSPLVR